MFFASSDLKLSIKRFVEQAKETGFYQEIKIFSRNDLTENKKKQIEAYFKNQKKDFMVMHVGNQKLY